jgi:hypothetical protein
MKKIAKAVMDAPGFSTDMALTGEELLLFRTEIEKQWLDTLYRECPEYASQFAERGIHRYHELSHLIDHTKIWNKSNRCLPQEVVKTLKKKKFFSDLTAIFGHFAISDIAYDDKTVSGQEEIYWRLVRPNVPTDVGPLHADSWFHEILGMKGKAFPEDAFTLKIWIPVYCEPGKNGLLLVPDSHKRTWRHSMKMVDNIPKPVFEDQADAVLINTPPGNMLIFHENMLHGGALNVGNQTRVSTEITMVFEKELNIQY